MDEDIFIEFKCPGCGDPIAFPEARAGLLEECPICMGVLIVAKEAGGEGRPLPLPIRTARLTLRRFTRADLEATLALFNDPALSGTVVQPFDEPACLRWLDGRPKVRLTQPGEGLQLAMGLTEAGKIVGLVTAHCPDIDRFQAEIGGDVMQGHQRQGYFTEAMRALLEFCLRDLGMHRVTARSDSTNTACRCVLERIGMRGEGEFKKDRLVDGAWVDTVSYALLQEELAAAPAPES
jgi:aminoglycoside 6'-N-acetyltransferase